MQYAVSLDPIKIWDIKHTQNTFTHVSLQFCSGVWGFAKLKRINAVQNRAIRYFVDNPRFSPNLAINGDMGQSSSQTKPGVEMGRLWKRLVNMENDCHTEEVFLYRINLFVNITGAMNLNSYFQIMDLRIRLSPIPV